MAGTKIETTLAYKLDARGLRDAKRELEKSFKPETVKALNTALKDAKARLKDLSAEYVRAAKAQGTMANFPKQLRDNIKAAREEAQRLTKDLEEQLDEERKILAVHAQERSQAKADRGTAFRQGALQGFGGPLATFLQRRGEASTDQQRAELWAQFKGQMIGGAARSALGAGRAGVGMASGMVGGAGPMGAMLGGVPFLGGAAQLAEGAVGQFVARQQAQLAALPYGGGKIMRQGTPGRAAVAGTPTRWDMPLGLTPIQRAEESAGARADKAEVDAWIAKRTEEEWKAKGGSLAKIRGEYEQIGAETLAAKERRRRSKMTGAVRVPGTEAIPAVAGKRALTATDLMAEATHGILSKTESIQAGTEFTRGVGGQFDPGAKPGQGQFAQAFAAQTRFVDTGTAAQLFRQQRAGRGGSSRDPTQMLARTIGDAFAQNLDGSEVNEYLEAIAGAQADAASKGMKLETETLTQMGVALSRGLGMAGPQAGRIAGNIVGLTQNTVTQGARGPIDIQLLRAAGFDPEKGNFLDARRKLASIKEGGMDAGMMYDFLANLAGEGGGEKERGYTLERAGLGLGTEQAITMGNMLKRGKGAFMESFAGKGGLTTEDLLAGMKGADVMGTTGAIRGQAALQDRLVDAGAAAAENVQKLQIQAAKLAETLTTEFHKPMTTIADNIVKLSKGIEEMARMVGDWGSSDGIRVHMVNR